MSNKFTFSVTSHVQTRENLLISLNVAVFWFDFLLLIPGVMYTVGHEKIARVRSIA